MNDLAKRTCKTCKFELPIAAFPKNGTKRNYTGHHCQECVLRKKREWHRRWRNANREKIRAYGREFMRQRREALPDDVKVAVKRDMAEKAQVRRDKLRMIVFAAYGGYKCACCGETEPDFLSFDHVNNDGYIRGKNGEPRSGEPLYQWLIKNKFPSDFQVLCMNCNHGKSRNGGVCPHKTKEPSTTSRET